MPRSDLGDSAVVVSWPPYFKSEDGMWENILKDINRIMNNDYVNLSFSI